MRQPAKDDKITNIAKSNYELYVNLIPFINVLFVYRKSVYLSGYLLVYGYMSLKPVCP